MKTRLIYKEGCPICRRALKVDTTGRCLVYRCKNSHYEYLESDDYGGIEPYVEFVIPNYCVTYLKPEHKFRINHHNGRDAGDHIMTVPVMDLDWRKLNLLSERIKKLITFS
jgi:hypothetical protein